MAVPTLIRFARHLILATAGHWLAIRLRRQLDRTRDSDPQAVEGKLEINSEDPEHPDNWLSLNYVHDQVLKQLEEQSKLWEAADGRLRLILSVVGIIFAVTLGLVPRGTTAVAGTTSAVLEPQYLPTMVGGSGIVAVLLFAVAGAISAGAYWPTRFDWPPHPAGLRDNYLTTDERETKLVVVDSMIAAYDINEDRLRWKFRAFKWAMGFTVAATALLGWAVIIQLALLTRAWA